MVYRLCEDGLDGGAHSGYVTRTFQQMLRHLRVVHQQVLGRRGHAYAKEGGVYGAYVRRGLVCGPVSCQTFFFTRPPMNQYFIIADPDPV